MLTAALLVAAGIYNDAAAPPAPVTYSARTSTLAGGPAAAPGPELPLDGGQVAVGSRLLLDGQAARFVPLSGAASFAANSSAVESPVASGEVFGWTEPGAQTVVHVRDWGAGTAVAVPVPSGLDPLPGTLRVGDRLAVWSYDAGDGLVRPAAFDRHDLAVSRLVVPLVGNLTVLATAADVVFIGGPGQDLLLWAFNRTSGSLEAIAQGEGLSDLSVGRSFVTWVNRSSQQAEYFDVATARVDTFPLQNAVRPVWVRAAGDQVMVGGQAPGLIGEVLRVWYYDFSTGVADAYSDLGVPFEQATSFDLADHMFVAVLSKEGSREQAPYTVALLGAAVLGMLATAYLGLQEALQGQDEDEA